MDIVKRMRAGEPCADFGADKTCRAKEARSGCTCAEVADEIERLRQVEFFAKEVLKRFREAEAQGYHTKDRQFAIELLGKAIPADDEQSAAASKRAAK